MNELPHKKPLCFNIFHKKDSIYLIIPFRQATEPNLVQLHLTYYGQPLQTKKSRLKHSYEPISILEYDLPSTRNVNQIIISYQGNSVEITLERENIKHAPDKLSLTTLFKKDFHLVNRFYDCYLSQGVEQFYLYYNGIITDSVAKVCDKNEITLIEWNYSYWNDSSREFRHHAQMGQMHDALYRYGKGNFEYMIFCDLDEYLHIPGDTLMNFIQNNDYDKIGFLNHWATDFQEYQSVSVSNTFKISEPSPFPRRAKCIYKVESVELLGIHDSTLSLNYGSEITSFMNLHFYNWSGKGRRIPSEMDHIFEIR